VVGWIVSGVLLDQLFENSPTMLVILKLVEARARRREQNYVAWPGRCRSLLHGGFDRS
jgi:hypothetical protein